MSKPKRFEDSFTTDEATFAVEVGRSLLGDSSEQVTVTIDCNGAVHGDEETIDVLIEMLEKARDNLKARRDAPTKVLRIQSTHNDPGAHWIERYFLRSTRGAYRELKKIPGNGQYAPDSGEILAWFKQLGVTHVEVAPGWHDTVRPRTYSLGGFTRHMLRVSKEALR